MTKFKSLDDYLDKIGAEKFPPRNQWEYSRFKAKGYTCVVYINKKGRHNFSNKVAREVYEAYEQGIVINVQTTKRKYDLKKKFKAKLWRRDKRCFYSFKKLPFDELTIEHLIPLSKGGKNNIDNLVLCSKEENAKMGNKSLLEKLRYREEKFLSEMAGIKLKTKKVGIIRKFINKLSK
jgi:CRISPR/Cas system Type II protein with McrA/HNH and RuvC-like nuclease domain